MWGKLARHLIVAYFVVGINWLFIILFVGISTGIHTKGSEHYMTPDGVSLTFYLPNTETHNFSHHSSGVGSVMGPLVTKRSVSPANIFGFSSQCSYLFWRISPSSSGPEGILPSTASIGGRLDFISESCCKQTIKMAANVAQLV